MGEFNIEKDNENITKIVNISRKGQATIPKKLRKKHNIKTPGKVIFYENKKGEIVIKAVPSIREFKGMGEKPKDEEYPGTKALKEARKKDQEREDRLRKYTEKDE